jgi:creatinine amidohydrolase/Fe(II)-dependent formamide hydrolase-like protein
MKKKTYMLEDMTWKESKELFKKTEIAIINVGAMHTHGTGCPLGTDNIGAYEIAKRINDKCVEKRISVVILPNIPFGYNNYHGDFEGNISIDRPTLSSYYWNVVKWLHKWGIRKLIWNSPHGGNWPNIQEVAIRARNELGMFSVRFGWDATAIELTRDGVIDTPIRDGCEGLIMELSLVAAVRPDTVDFSDASFKDYEQPFGDLFPVLDYDHIKFGKSSVFAYLGTRTYTSTGGFGPEELRDFSKASVEHGKTMVDGVVNYIVDFIEAYKKLKIPSEYFGTGF